MKTWLLFSLALMLPVALLSPPVRANVILPSVFSDNMVLQRETKVPIWGWANPRERVTLAIGKWKSSVTAGTDGKWQVRLPKYAAGGPYTITITASNTLTLSDVLFGEVWLCSGQSNMQMYVGPSKYGWRAGGVENYAQVIAAADFPQIRLFDMPFDEQTLSLTPKRDNNGKWMVCSPQTAGDFAAVPFFLARKLHHDLQVPIGLLNVSLGGSQVEPWISPAAFRREDCLKPFTESWEQSWSAYQASLATDKPLPNPMSHMLTPSALYNGMLAPLVPYGIRGIAWYQGESNANKPEAYAARFQALIRDWRTQWGRPNLPFLYVQLANIGGEGFARLREAQRQALVLPNTAMVVTIDTDFSLHPKKKQPVGDRLALAAEAIAYRRKIEYSGPLYAGITIAGHDVFLRFTHLGNGLASRDGKPLHGFTLAGPDGKFVPAEAVIEKDTIRVHSDAVPQPVTVRYAWTDDPNNNLINANGLPASPFVAVAK
ncbi:MAG: sialate O-acetylesterase [Armatimonadota bacterium]